MFGSAETSQVELPEGQRRSMRLSSQNTESKAPSSMPPGGPYTKGAAPLPLEKKWLPLRGQRTTSFGPTPYPNRPLSPSDPVRRKVIS